MWRGRIRAVGRRGPVAFHFFYQRRILEVRIAALKLARHPHIMEIGLHGARPPGVEHKQPPRPRAPPCPAAGGGPPPGARPPLTPAGARRGRPLSLPRAPPGPRAAGGAVWLAAEAAGGWGGLFSPSPPPPLPPEARLVL